MSNEQHTPTPWYYAQGIEDGFKQAHFNVTVKSRRFYHSPVARCYSETQNLSEAEANAAFILKACNNYEKMKSVIEKLLPAVKELNGEYQEGWDDEISEAAALISELNKTD